MNMHQFFQHKVKATQLRNGILCFLIILIAPGIAYSACTSGNTPEELDPITVRNFVRGAYGLVDASDALLDNALLKYSRFSTSPYIDIFRLIMSTNDIVCSLNNFDYHSAVEIAVEYSATLALRNTLIGSSLSNIWSIANLAALPYEFTLNWVEYNAVKDAWNNQVGLYTWARIMGYSHEFIMNGISDDTVLFTDDGWLYIVGDHYIPSYGAVRPGDYQRDQVYGAAQEEYRAYFATATYPQDKELIGSEFKTLIYPNIIYSPSKPTAPVEISFSVSGSLLDELNITDYFWDFGDGETTDGQSVSHFYWSPGEYSVSVSLTDSSGGKQTITETVVVLPPPIHVDYSGDCDSLTRQFSTSSSDYVLKSDTLCQLDRVGTTR